MTINFLVILSSILLFPKLYEININEQKNAMKSSSNHVWELSPSKSNLKFFISLFLLCE